MIEKHFARLVGDVVFETIPFDPTGLFPSEFEWVECPADTPQGARYDRKAKTFTPDETRESVVEVGGATPPSVDPPAPEPAFRLKLTPSEFRNAFSAFEEVAIVEYSEARPDGEDPAATTLRKVVGVFFDRVRDRHLTEVDLGDERNLGGLDLLVSVGILTTDRRAAIARGLPA
ncbi:hypothetical protein [Aureimonas ureilytica]|uniref:hypothetical protein n=1 Tax=Aureimonas ureilytica TaxID=401562 RepID=UPI00036FD1FA|nr:hypothetical protein [Aureimonas ureilytica]